MRAKTVDLSGRHLLVLTPAYDGTVPIEFMMSYLATLRELHKHGVVASMECRLGCAIIEKARNELLHTARESEATDYLFLDADLSWQPDDILRLMTWATDCPAVSGCYPVKQDEPLFHISPTPDEQGCIIQNEYGLIKANAVPGGFLLLRSDAVKQFAEGAPCYRPGRGDHKGKRVANLFGCIHEGETFYGEDVAFCLRWRRAGLDIWVDPAVSAQHIGRKVYDTTYLDFIQQASPAMDSAA